MLIQGDPLRRRGLSELILAQLAGEMRLAASAAADYDGRRPPEARCIRVLRRAGLALIYTRDTGMHSSGWFKNPDFERCLHLSISFRDSETGQAAPFEAYVAERLCRAFFGSDTGEAWIEGPKTPGGIRLGVMHYRVFCDEGWQPRRPRGEVYSLELAEAGWRSWSDLHGDDPEPSSLHAG